MTSSATEVPPGYFKTSVGFLDRLRDEFGESWYRLNDIYVPLIQGWLRRHGLGPADADDVAQNVLIVVQQKLPNFERRRVGSFRCWLRQITVNCLRDFRRNHWKHAPPRGGDDILDMLNNLEQPQSDLSRLWDAQHDAHVLRFAMKEAQAEFSPQTWQAFFTTTMKGQSPRDVAEHLGMSENAVRIAKSRVKARIREIVQGLLD